MSIDVELGNAAPLDRIGDSTAPCVTYVSIPAGQFANDAHHGFELDSSSGHSGQAVLDHIARSVLDRDGVTHLPGYEPLLAVVHPDGIWRKHAQRGSRPTWVWSSNEELAQLLAQFYECPVGRPADVEDTHHTVAGPPGVHPPLATDPVDLQNSITQNGRDIQSRLFGGKAAVFGKTTTAPTATTLTLTGQSAPGSTTAWNGQIVVASLTAAATWGRIKSNTTAAPPVLTVDRWYKPTAPGTAAAATTPAITSVYCIVDAPGPCWFMGLTASATTPASPATTTSLPTEIATATGGLVRAITTYAHTASATTTTLTGVFTANTHDTLPVTIAKAGVFNSMVKADTVQTLMFVTKLSATATLSASGDQLTVTETITGS